MPPYLGSKSLEIPANASARTSAVSGSTPRPAVAIARICCSSRSVANTTSPRSCL